MSLEREIKREIRNLLKELGASITAKGFNYTVEVICAGVINDTPIVKGSKLCAHWAPVFGVTYARTGRAFIR